VSGLNISFKISAIDDFSRTMNDLNSQIRDVMSAAGELGKAVSAAGLAVSAGLGFAAKKAMDFEAQMSSVKSVMSPDEVAKFGGTLEQLAVQMGEKTKYSALEAAQGIEELIKAGVSVTDIVNGGLEGALSLATAGELELAEAAEIASTALNAFRDDGLSVIDAANILAGAANASATSVSEMRYGLSMVSAVASGLGLSFKDTSTALAVFAQNGLKGSDAGTSLKTMLSNLIPKSDDAYETMRELGIIAKDGSNAFFDAQGNVRSMAEIAGVLQNSLKGLNAEQRQQVLYTMFGSDAIRAANILFKEGAKGVEQMWASMSKVTAAEVAAEKMNNVKGRIEELKGAMETAAISIGNALLPAINVIVAALQKLVEWFNGLSPTMKSVIAITAAVAAGLMLIVGPMLILIGFIPSIIAGFGAIAGALGMTAGALAGIIGIAAGVIAGIVALGAAFVIAYQKIDWFRNFVNQAWAQIKAYFQTALTFISGIVSQVMSVVSAFISEKLAQIRAFWQENGLMILQAAQNVWNVIKAVISTVMNVIVAIMNVAWPLIKAIIVSVWEAIKGVINGALNIIMGVVTVFAALFTGNWRKLWEGVKQFLFGTVQFIWNFISLMFIGRILNIFKLFATGAKSLFTTLWSGVKAIFTSALNVIKTAVTSYFNFVKTTITASMNGVKSFLSTVWNTVKNIFTNGLSAIKTAVSNGMNAVKTKITSVWNKVVEYFKGIDLKQVGKNIIQGLIDGITSMVGSLMNKAKSIANSVKNTIKKALDIHSPSRVMMELGEFTGEGFALGLNKTLRDINVTADRLAYAAVPSVEPSNYSAGGSTTIQQPINITLNYSGSGSPADAYQIVDILERELGNRIGSRLRYSGVKG
jgi:TP901 family phage tail tape measure protein